MPLKLSTTIGKIQNIPNTKNIEIINDFLEYMRNNGSSEHHQNNNLKVVIAFSNFIGKDKSFYDIIKKEQILEFLNTKVKHYDIDPDKRWITTWNNYLNRLRLFFVDSRAGRREIRLLFRYRILPLVSLNYVLYLLLCKVV